MNEQTIIKTKLPVPIVNKGKVRDIYYLDDALLLIVTDRISAYDYVLPNPIPSKGICLTQLSKFWFDYTENIVSNHMISTDISEYPKELQGYDDQLKYRSMLVKKAKVMKDNVSLNCMRCPMCGEEYFTSSELTRFPE